MHLDKDLQLAISGRLKRTGSVSSVTGMYADIKLRVHFNVTETIIRFEKCRVLAGGTPFSIGPAKSLVMITPVSGAFVGKNPVFHCGPVDNADLIQGQCREIEKLGVIHLFNDEYIAVYRDGVHSVFRSDRYTDFEALNADLALIRSICKTI
jgi:hypothetical protein